VRSFLGITIGLEQDDGFPRRKGHSELVKRQRKSFSVCLDQGFFAGPAIEEGLMFHSLWKGSEGCDFTRREEVPSILFLWKISLNKLKVNADPWKTTDCIERKIV
jgi:hypothetical protein